MERVISLTEKILVLTGEVRHCLQLFLPELGDLNRLAQALLACCGHALLVGVVHHLLEEVWL